MSEDKTAKTLPLPSFEASVLVQLETISSRLASLEMRVGKIEADTKPNWEGLHRDFSQLHKEMNESFGNLTRKLDVMNRELFQVKADQQGLETRLDKMESESRPQIIVQDQDF
jgi:hypothetical protein